MAYHEVTEKISYTSTTGEGDDAKEVSYTKRSETLMKSFRMQTEKYIPSVQTANIMQTVNRMIQKTA